MDLFSYLLRLFFRDLLLTLKICFLNRTTKGSPNCFASVAFLSQLTFIVYLNFHSSFSIFILYQNFCNCFPIFVAFSLSVSVIIHLIIFQVSSAFDALSLSKIASALCPTLFINWQASSGQPLPLPLLLTLHLSLGT